MGFVGPTPADLQDAAARLGLTPLSDADAATIRASLDKSVSAFHRLDALPDPVIEGADMSPRTEGHVPTRS